MPSADLFRRFIFEHSQIRGAWVHLSNSFAEVAGQADYSNAARQLLGESLCASVLMSSTLKFEGLLSIQARGQGGPVSTLLAECTHDRFIRGIVRGDSSATAGGERMSDLLGHGQMVITITPEEGQRYQGIVPMEKDRLSGCLQDYFERSEQLDTMLVLQADEDRAAGFMLQKLPEDENADPDLWSRICKLTETLSRDELLDLDSETIIRRLFHEEQVRLFEPSEVAFRCSCSRARTLAALESIGRKECYDILEEQGSIEMDCQFCHARYHFLRADIDQLFGGQSLH